MISTLYILAVVLMTAVPCHFYLGSLSPEAATLMSQPQEIESWVHHWLVLGTLGSLLLGIVATVAPLAVGVRAFRRLEF